LTVNLLMNRASPWADVDSYLPYEGQADIRLKCASELAVRIPEWVRPEQVVGEVDGVARPLSWGGRFAQVGQVAAGAVVTLRFPIAEQVDRVYVEKQRYTLVRKGNDVVAIDPPGRICPLYLRDHYRQNRVRWRKMSRFAPAEQITW
jgi:hypothetical protein